MPDETTIGAGRGRRPDAVPTPNDPRVMEPASPDPRATLPTDDPSPENPGSAPRRPQLAAKYAGERASRAAILSALPPGVVPARAAEVLAAVQGGAATLDLEACHGALARALPARQAARRLAEEQHRAWFAAQGDRHRGDRMAEVRAALGGGLDPVSRGAEAGARGASPPGPPEPAGARGRPPDVARARSLEDAHASLVEALGPFGTTRRLLRARARLEHALARRRGRRR